jgi:hypothetical protein
MGGVEPVGAPFLASTTIYPEACLHTAMSVEDIDAELVVPNPVFF